MQNLTPLILALPLVGFLVIGLFGRLMPRALISLLGCGLILAAFVAAAMDFLSMVSVPAAEQSSDSVLFTWITSGSLRVNFGLLSDPLSAVMLLVVTGVGFLIHVYSVGYMAEDVGYWRFFAFLNFFVFVMALLVAADDFVFLLIGWAGVGLASFLLIGYWYTRPAAVAAARKAFIVNVIGDVGLMLAIFVLFTRFGTLAYGPILHSGSWLANACAAGHCAATGLIAPGTTTAIALLLFVAAAAKSAQLPLHVWLPDAMEGPTPVSALIHAATMVTAGVYLVARAAAIFSSSPTALAVVGGVGGVTALFTATIACVQTDIKRVLAYSTMSQLGYMFMAESVGGYAAGIFHLTTHAYFKALLFMCAGAVIHALGGEQDMRKMGGLRHALPRTFWSFVIGGLALAAIVPFAGFWSKDSILGVLLQRAAVSGQLGWFLLYGAGLVTALLTGFYIFRLIFVIFFGSYRGEPIAWTHGPATPAPASSPRNPLAGVREPGASMLLPTGTLAALSVVGGLYGTPWGDWIGQFLTPVLPAAQRLPVGSGLFWLAFAASLALAGAGIGIAWARYGHGFAPAIASRKPLVRLLVHAYYVDDLYEHVIVQPLLALGRGLRIVLEDWTLDRGTQGLGRVFGRASAGLRALQTGYARTYALAIFLGAALIALYYVTRP